MTFQTNWNNLVLRNEAMNTGTLTPDIKDNLPMSDNFKAWANANWVPVKAKLESQPELTVATPLSIDDYTNWILLTSNKYLAKEWIFPISDELSEMMLEMIPIEDQIREETLAILNNCVVCDAPRMKNDDTHCGVCDSLLRFADHDKIKAKILSLSEMSGEISTHTEMIDNVFVFSRVSSFDLDIRKPAYKRLNYKEMSWEQLQENGNEYAKREMNNRRFLMWNRLSNTRTNCPDGALVPYSQDPIQVIERLEREHRIEEAKARKTLDEKEADDNEDEDDPRALDEHVLQNSQYVGVDKYGDDLYTDFDADGVFQPMGNPNNSSDTRDDTDMTNRHTYRAQNWESEDFIDDHNIDLYYHEQVISESPTFVETRKYNQWEMKWETVESIEWENETSPNSAIPVNPHSDVSWMDDARNWLTRETLLRQTDNPEIQADIMISYEVSDSFLDYIDEQGIDFEVATQRMNEYLGIRADEDAKIREKAVQRYHAGENIDEICADLSIRPDQMGAIIGNLNF